MKVKRCTWEIPRSGRLNKLDYTKGHIVITEADTSNPATNRLLTSCPYSLFTYGTSGDRLEAYFKPLQAGIFNTKESAIKEAKKNADTLNVDVFILKVERVVFPASSGG